MRCFIKCYCLLFFCTLSAVATAAESERYPTTLAAPELAKVWSSDEAQDPSLYLISEKLDGVRARWNGEQLFSRSGMRINAPAWFTAGFPHEPLEGELWGGYNSFDKVSLLARDLGDEADWRSVQYWLFDAPAAQGHFELRYRHFLTFDGMTPYLKVIPQQVGQSVELLQQQLARVVQRGGEGLVLHRRDAPLVSGRSPYLFKLKPIDDAEAKVLAILPGQGKYQEMMGSLLVETSEGVRFKIGTGFSDEQRSHPPAIGSWITFAHNGYTSGGKPRFARFIRVRSDYELSRDAAISSAKPAAGEN
ncbi:DNA ligase [Shewanella sp. A3A]|nr:DNA ligase [Shewanella ferrihydritica]